MTMERKSRRKFRNGRAEPIVLLPPNIQTMGSVPFTAKDFAKLDAWLAEEGWPSDRMDAAMLEGYLVALLAWPIELPPGAWLPSVWGIRGWKVAAKIATTETYATFIGLIIGLFQELERRLTASPPARTFVLEGDAPYMSGRYFAGAAWATGFMTALHQNSTGLRSRSAAVVTAVEDIAHYASLRSTDSSELPSVATALSVAVMIIVTDRPPRQPLGRTLLKDAALGMPATVAPGIAGRSSLSGPQHIGGCSE
jgi:yecA family protein